VVLLELTLLDLEPMLSTAGADWRRRMEPVGFFRNMITGGSSFVWSLDCSWPN
jgi:hypothetical protein